MSTRILFISLLSLALIAISGSVALAQQSPGENITCPLDKEVPVGQIINQLEYTNDQILRQLQSIDDAAVRILQNGKSLTELTAGCQTSNCNSDCRSEDVPTPCNGTPSTSCTPGYTCTYQSTVPGSSAPNTSCTTLPTTGSMTINPSGYYGLFGWRENSGYPCNPYDCPDSSFNPNAYYCTTGDNCVYQNYTHTGQEIISGGYSRQSCVNLPNNLSINASSTYAIYQWSGVHGAGWCNVLWPTTTCYDTCYNEGGCSVDWTCTTQVCRQDACSGQACNFTEISAKMNTISQSTQTIRDSNQAIIDIFDKKVAELPLLGNICQIPGIGVVCDFCDIFSLIFTGCKTEIETILSLLQKSLTNVKDCWNDPADYEKIISGEKSGKFLMSCEELRPGVLKECYPNNFFCCK
ncbi:MAG: hypothetical protein HY577_02270 [Candidatus Nealsonbacteria bacterium]|nr:hypothetical protein [Candidatus Nealsonbacteria bacterium]